MSPQESILRVGVDSRPAEKGGERVSNVFDKLSTKANSVGAAYAGLTKKVGLLSKVFVVLASAAVLGALTRGLSAVISVSKQFEAAMSKVAAITRATVSDLKAMRDAAKELGATTAFTAAQAASGFKFLGQAGFSAKESLLALPGVLNLAAAAALDLASAADVASNVLSGFGIKANETTRVVDVLAATSSRSNTSVMQLTDALSVSAPIARSLSITIEQTAATIGTLSDAGIQGARAGTALRGVLASLAGPTAQAQAALAKYGLTAAQVNPETQSLSEIFGRLKERGLSTADAMTIFGREAASGALVLVEASERVGQFGKELRNVKGAAEEMASVMRDNLQGDVTSLSSALQGLAIALGDLGITAALRAAVQAATSFVRAVTSITEAVGDAGAWVLSFGSFAASLEQVQIASDVANLAIADQLAQVTALDVATQGGRVVTLDYATAQLENAKASLAAAEAIKQARIETIKSEPAYQELIERQRELNADVRMLSDILSDSPSEEARKLMEFLTDPTNPDSVEGFVEQLERAIDKTKSIVREQELLLGTVDGSTEAHRAATEQIALYEEAIRIARGGVVTLGAVTTEAADTTSSLARLAGGINFEQAINGASALADRLGVSLGLATQIASLVGTGSSGDEVFDPCSSKYNAGLQKEANRIAKLKEIRESFEAANKAAAKLEATTKRVGGAAKKAGSTAAEATQSAIEKLTLKIEQERELIGLSDEALDKIDARHQVESALAKDKIVWNKEEIDALSEKILLNKELLAEEKARAQVLGKIADGIASGDIKGIGDSILGQAQTSFSDLLKGAFSSGGGIGDVVSGLKSSIAGIGAAFKSGAGLLGSIGGAVSAALPIIGAVSAAISFFSTTTTELNAGLRVTTTGMTALVETFKTLRKVKFFGLSNKVSTNYDLASADVSNPIQSAINSIGETVTELSDVLGLASDNIANTTFEFSVSTKDKTDEQIQAAIAAEMTRLGNTFADAVIGSYTEFLPDEAEIQRLDRLTAETFNIGGRGGAERGIEERAAIEQQRLAAQTAIEVVHLNGALAGFQREGEGSLAMLERIVGNIAGVNESLYVFNQDLRFTGIEGAKAATALVDLRGGLEQFTSEAQFVFENMLTSTAQELRLTEIATEQLNGTLGALGIAIPQTHAEFMAMLNAQDLMTEGGRNTHAALLSVAQAFVQVNGTAQEAADAIASANSAMRAAQVSAAQDVVRNRAAVAADAMSDADAMLRAAFEAERTRLQSSQSSTLDVSSTTAKVSLFNSIRDALQAAFTDRRVLTVLDQSSQLSKATEFLRKAISDGGTSDLDALKEALSAVADPSADLFSSFEDYQHDYNVNTNLIERLKGLTDDSLSVEERTLSSLEAQSSLLESNNASQLAALDAQMNALLGIDSSVLSIADAIASYNAAQRGVSATSGATAPVPTEFEAGGFGAALDAMYRELLGRGVQQAGLDFYGGLFAGGFGLDQIRQDILGSAEREQFELTGIPSYANGTSFHPGGPANTHANELITVPNMPRGSSVSTAGEVSEMANEIRAMRQSNDAMAIEIRQLRRLAQSRTDIVEEQRAEELAAGAT